MTRHFPDVFADHARGTPDRIAFTVTKPRGKELLERSWTCAETLRRADRAAAHLHAAGVQEGDRVIVSLRSVDEIFFWFLGAQRLGAIPVLLPSLAEYDAPAVFEERVAKVVADCTPRVIVRDGQAPSLSGVEPLPAIVPARVPATAPAFLQYTSGSTGSPKGVIITHANLIANLGAIAAAARFTSEDRCFSWLPLYHDMGLIGGLLLPLWLGLPVSLMSPRSFVTRPDAWLRAIHRFRATYTVAPNFAYSLVAKRLPDSMLEGLDLSSLRLAFDGAEPIDRETADAFSARLAPYGLRPNAFYPVYGLAEHTLAAAFPEPGAPVHTDELDRSIHV